jgi:hypothetical protein
MIAVPLVACGWLGHDEPAGPEDPAEVLKPSERVGGVVQDPVGEDIVEHLGAEATLEQVHLDEVSVGEPLAPLERVSLDSEL